jgi:hypothetical protein
MGSSVADAHPEQPFQLLSSAPIVRCCRRAATALRQAWGAGTRRALWVEDQALGTHLRLLGAVSGLPQRPEASGVEQQRLPVVVLEVFDLADPQHVIAGGVNVNHSAG